MTLVTIHAPTGKDVRELLSLVDTLEEHQVPDGVVNNEHRYAGIKGRKDAMRTVTFSTKLQAADLIAHFHQTGTAQPWINRGVLNLLYNDEVRGVKTAPANKIGFLPSVLEAQPF